MRQLFICRSLTKAVWAENLPLSLLTVLVPSTEPCWADDFLGRAELLRAAVGSLVCRGLIKNGERQDEESVGGRRRTEALRHLCKMNPSQALRVRGMVVSLTRESSSRTFLKLQTQQSLSLSVLSRWKNVTCRVLGWL